MSTVNPDAIKLSDAQRDRVIEFYPTRKIEAIKFVRSETNCQLEVGKVTVEKIWREHGPQPPPSYRSSTSAPASTHPLDKRIDKLEEKLCYLLGTLEEVERKIDTICMCLELEL